MTEAELSELEAKAKVATPGPWWAERSKHVLEESAFAYVQSAAFGIARMSWHDGGDSNASFIAASNPLVALALIAEIRRLREADSVLNCTDEEINARIRMAGGDPEEIGQRGKMLADALLRVRELTDRIAQVSQERTDLALWIGTKKSFGHQPRCALNHMDFPSDCDCVLSALVKP